MPRRAAILKLFCISSPFTVSGRIWAIIIDSFQGKSLGTFPHIFKKGSEIMKPAMAHFYSSSSIIYISWMINICATLFHVMPRSIFSCVGTAMRFASCTQQFTLQAAARFTFATSQARTSHRGFLAAITFTQPELASEIGQCN